MSVEIRVYPNKLINSEYERLSCDVGLTVEQWLIENVPNYEVIDVPLYSVTLNGLSLPQETWGRTTLLDGNLLEFFVEAKEPTTIAMVVIAVVSAATAIYYSNQAIPDNYNSTNPAGSSIYDANAQGNRPKLMGVVPELGGEHKMFPDYLVPTRRQSDGRDEYFFALLCVSVGSVVLPLDKISIGNTPITTYGEDVDAVVFGPGEDLSGHPAHLNVIPSPDVRNFEILGSKVYKEYVPLSGELTLTVQRAAADGFRELHRDLDVYSTPDDEYEERYHTERLEGLEVGQYIDIYESSYGALGLYQVIGYFQEPIPDGGLNYGESQSWVTELAPVDQDLVLTGQPADFSAVPLNGQLSMKYRVIEKDGAGDLSGKYNIVQDGVSVKKIHLNFRFPQGIAELNDSGVPIERSIHIRAWLDGEGMVPFQVEYIFTESTVDELAFTKEIDLPSGATSISIRVQRVTRDMDDLKYKDKCIWSDMGAEVQAATMYEGVTTLAIKIRGTNTLASTSENKINCVPVRILEIYDENGEFTQSGATRDIAPFVYYMLRNAGYSDAQIDLDELYRLHQIWVARGDEFNAVFDNESTIWEALKRVLAAGFAEPTLDFGQVVPVRDEKREHLNYMYQADNMIKNSWKMEATLFDEAEPDGIEVEYFSSETWKPETIICTLPGEGGLRPEKVRAYGITNRTKAYQFGMRKRSALRYRRKRHTWATEMDGLNSNYLSYDALGIDIPGYSQTGRVEGINGRSIKVNQDLEWVVGVNYLGLRNPEGLLSGPYVCTKGNDVSTVIIDADLDFIPVMDGTQEPPLFMFGSDRQWCERILITDIKPSGSERVQLKAVNDDDRVYLYDDAEAPN